MVVERSIQQLKRLGVFQNKPPFELIIRKGIDASRTSPYYVETVIYYGDPTFKKRMSAVLKKKRYYIEYDFLTVNNGTFLKPVIIKIIDMQLKRRLLNKSDAMLIDMLTLGLAGASSTKGNVITLDNSKKRRDYFIAEEESSLFASKIEELLYNLISEEYEEYRRLLPR